MPSGVRGKEIQGLMRSLKDACGQYRNFTAGPAPECEGCHGRTQEIHAKHKQSQGHTIICAKRLICLASLTFALQVVLKPNVMNSDL